MQIMAEPWYEKSRVHGRVPGVPGQIKFVAMDQVQKLRGFQLCIGLPQG